MVLVVRGADHRLHSVFQSDECVLLIYENFTLQI